MTMTNRRSLAALLIACFASTVYAADPAQVTLTVSQEAAGPRIEPAIYGQFVEHLGVNLSPAHAARVRTNLDAAATAAATGRILTAPSMSAHNTFEEPNAITLAPFAAPTVDGKLTVDLPAKSVVVLSLRPSPG